MSTVEVRPGDHVLREATTEWPFEPTAVGAATEPPDVPAALFAVVVHDDDAHSDFDCVQMLEEVFGYSEQMAYQLTQVIDAAGRAAVWKGGRDDAEQRARQARHHQPKWHVNHVGTELAGDQAARPPLTVSVEPADGAEQSTKGSEPTVMHRVQGQFARQIVARLNRTEFTGRSCDELTTHLADAVAGAGHQLPREPSLETVKRLLVELLRIVRPALPPVTRCAASTTDALRNRFQGPAWPVSARRPMGFATTGGDDLAQLLRAEP